MGRFVSTDPFEGVQNDPVSLHKYLYAYANPVMYVDPSGQLGVISMFLKSPAARRLLAKLGLTTVLTATTFGIIAHEAILRDIVYFFEPLADKLSIKGAGPNGGYGFVDVYVPVHVPPNQFYEIKVSGTSGSSQISRYSATGIVFPGTNARIARTINNVPVYIKKFPVACLFGIKVSYWYQSPGLIWYDVGLSQTGQALATASTLFPMMYSINKNRMASQQAMAFSFGMLGIL